MNNQERKTNFTAADDASDDADQPIDTRPREKQFESAVADARADQLDDCLLSASVMACSSRPDTLLACDHPINISEGFFLLGLSE